MHYSKILYLIAGLGVLTFFSCNDDFLNPSPASSVVATDFFSNDAQLENGVIAMYDAYQGVNENTESNWADWNRGIQFEYLVTEMRSDNTRSQTTEGSKADFHRYLVDANNVESEDYYASMYDAIFRANSVLSFIDVADEANIDRYTGEALFIRGMSYFNLVRLFGAVPLVTETVNPTDEAVFSRSGVEAVYAQVISDLEMAVALLPNSDASPTKGRASKNAARGLLAKVQLSAPTPDYAAADALCTDIINSDEYELLDNFSDVFYSERNEEVMFIVEYIPANSEESQSFSSEFNFFTGRQDGPNIPEPGLIAALQTFGGNRLDATIALSSNGQFECAKFYPDGFDQSEDYGPNSRQAGNDWIVMRYADVLLMRAEAILAGSQMTSDATAIADVNKVRFRAGVTDTLTTELTATTLLNERRVEFAFENQRFYDLERFGVINSTLSEYAAQQGYSYNVNQLLLPMPAREINLSQGRMTQNPGY